MQRKAAPAQFIPRILILSLLVCIVLLTTAPAYAEQEYISRYDLFAGYTYFNSPSINLVEHGVHFQFGVRTRTWLSLGFDYSAVAGDLTLTPDLLPTALQQQLQAQLTTLAKAGMLPAGYTLTVVSDSKTQTFAAGPQFSIHRWRSVTPFIRPSMGAIREVATPQPSDPIAKAIVAGLAPTGKKRDWQGFYGVGGGFDFNFSRHVALRVQADLVYDHLFDDILRDGRRTVRFSVSPAFNFGRNIIK